jgi:hypothetical protein
VQLPSGATWPSLSRIGGKYDLSYVFGLTPVFPTNPMTGKQSVLLYEVVTDKKEETRGLTMAQKLAALKLGEVIKPKNLLSGIDQQKAVALNVMMYSSRSGIPLSQMTPTRSISISNSAEILPVLLKPVTLGLDMNLSTLDSRKRFDATGTTSIGKMMDMVQKVLDRLGK